MNEIINGKTRITLEMAGNIERLTGIKSEFIINVENSRILKENIIRVGRNQIVQVIWKVQLGGMDQLGKLASLYPHYSPNLKWIFWEW